MTKLIVCTPRSLSKEGTDKLAAQIAEFAGTDVANVLVLTDGTTVCPIEASAAPAAPKSHKKTDEAK